MRLMSCLLCLLICNTVAAAALFEEGFDTPAKGIPENWHGLVSDNAADINVENGALHLRAGAQPGDAIVYNGIKLDLETGETYTFRAKVRTTGGFTGKLYLALYQYPAPFDKQRDQRDSEKLAGDSDWRPIALTFEARPGLEALQLRLGVMWRGDASAGDVWFDDIEILKGAHLPQPPPEEKKPEIIYDVQALNVDTEPVEGHTKIEPDLFRLDFPEADFSQQAPVMLTRPAPVGVDQWHFRTGVPIARGALTDADNVSLTRGGRTIPIQTETLATWGPPGTPDAGSIRWLGIDFIDDVEAGQHTDYRLHIGKRGPAPSGVTVVDRGQVVTVSNGRLELRLDKREFNPFANVKLDGRTLPASQGAYVTDEQGRRYLASNDRDVKLEVESRGPLAAVIRAEGWFVDPQGPQRAIDGEPEPRPDGGFCRFVTRLTVAAGAPEIAVQHTFILTEDSTTTKYGDIGMTLPAANAKAVAFGRHDPIAGDAYLLQHRWDRYTIHAGGETIDGEKAEGFARAGDTGVVVREFWQNYPKEISFNANEQAMTVHFWPAHGAPRVDDMPDFNYDNGWRLPFVHSGELLDFTVPQVLFDNEEEFIPNRVLYKKGAARANAIGVGKTHNLLISFKADDAFADRAAVYQTQPHLLASPRYIEHTEAVDSLAAAEPDKFPIAEHYMHNGYKWVIRLMQRYNSYGMWNFGDVNHYFRIPQQVKEIRVYPRWRRLWASTHHGYVRLPWWMYFRNGDPDLLDQARRHTQHIADVDICHWTDGAIKGKAVGGLCDYKGIVHWHSGNRAHYNALTDFLWYDYYLTGNRRARDIAMEHGHYVTQAGQSDNGREGAGQLDTHASMYEATWDKHYLDALTKLADRYLPKPWNHHHAQYWSPWPIRYWRVTGDERVKQWVLKWASEEQAHFGFGPVAYAWYMTGDEMWAKQAAQNIYLWSAASVVRGDDMDGRIGEQWNTQWSFPVRDMIMSMKAARTVNLTLRDLSPDSYNREGYPSAIPYWLRQRKTAEYYFKGKLPWPDVEHMREVIYFHHDGSPQRVRLGVRQQSGDLTMRVFGPSGDVVYERVREGAQTSGFREHNGRSREGIRVIRGEKVISEDYRGAEQLFEWVSDKLELGPGDARGFYRVQYESTDFWLAAPLYRPADNGRVWFPVGADSVWAMAGPVFFYVPDDCANFELYFLPPYYPPSQGRNDIRISSGIVLDPDMQTVGRIQCGYQTTPQVLSFEPTPAQRGKVWCVIGSEVTLTKMQGVAPFVSPTMEAFETAPRHPSR